MPTAEQKSHGNFVLINSPFAYPASPMPTMRSEALAGSSGASGAQGAVSGLGVGGALLGPPLRWYTAFGRDDPPGSSAGTAEPLWGRVRLC